MKTGANVAEAVRPAVGATKQEVVDAAIRCFDKSGAGSTTMGDIAKEANISRKTLYRMFEDRSDLMRRVLSQTLRVMGVKVERELKAIEDVRDAVIEGSILSVRVGLKDKLLTDIIRSETEYRVEQFLMLGNSRVRADMLRIWSPILERGRAEGLIRADLSNERITEILQNVHALLLIRDDPDELSQRRFLEDLLWSAISNTAAR